MPHRRVMLGALALAAAACGPGSSPGPDAGGVVGCTGRSDVDVYAQGLTRSSMSGAVQAELLRADPAPPARGMNTWSLRLSPPGPAPGVTPYMPEHGHGPSRLPKVASDGGTVTVTELDLFMPGVWQVTVAPADAGTADHVRFTFCVEG